MLAQMLGNAIMPNIVCTARLKGEPPWQLRLFSGEGCKEIWLYKSVEHDRSRARAGNRQNEVAFPRSERPNNELLVFD